MRRRMRWLVLCAAGVTLWAQGTAVMEIDAAKTAHYRIPRTIRRDIAARVKITGFRMGSRAKLTTLRGDSIDQARGSVTVIEFARP